MIEGGCLCGQVRYRMDAPALGQAVCHCRNCQRQGGSAFSVLMAARANALKITGETRVYEDRGDSGAAVHRHFCGVCGSPILSALPTTPGVVYLKAGTLDDPSAMHPEAHVWCDSAWPWTPFPDGAIKIAKNPG